MAAPPVEWVPGDPLWSRRFTFVESISFGGGLFFATLALFLTIPAFGSTYQLGPGLAESVGIPIGIALAAIPVWWLPRRRPVVRRVGISPTQLTLEYSFRKLTCLWSQVRWKDPFRIEGSKRLGTFQFLLTGHQAARIRAFFRSVEPLPSAAARWSGRAAPNIVR